MTTPFPDAKALAVEALEHVQETIRSLLRNDASRRNLGTLYSRVNDESHRLKAALSALQTPAPQPEELREAAARIIAPRAFEPLGPCSEYAEHMQELAQDFALARADQIMALLPSYRPPEGYAVDWQSIESAPRDGTRVLLYGTLEANAPDAADNYRWSTRAFPASVGEGYFAHGIWQFRQHAGIPTHWTPLPAPPPPSPEAQGEKL